MNKQKYIEYWIATAEHDLDSMKGIFEAGKYDWALFVGHLVLEKILKALWIKNNEGNFPPKIHNLTQLYKEAKLSILDEKDIAFLDDATGFNMEGRYPEAKYAFYKLCTLEFTEPRIKKIRKLYQCLLKEI